MFEKLLRELQKATSTSSFLADIQSALVQSRLYEILREIGRPKDIHPSTHNYLEVQAMQTAWSVGYNQCLDDIMMFREKFIEADLDRNPPKMSFGAFDLAVYKGDLTKEEADAIRIGKPIPKIKSTRSKTTSK